MILIHVHDIFAQIKKYLLLLLQQIGFLIAPPLCASCRRYTQSVILCKRCSHLVVPIVSTMLKITDRYEIKVFAVSDYKDPLRSIVLSKAASNQLASRQLGQLIWQLTEIKNSNFDYIIPIPLHWTRYASRGFNQAEEIAFQISMLSGKPLMQPLRRVKRTQFQSLIPFDKRRENLKEAFKVALPDVSCFKGKTLLLVDDVMTSGSTLVEAVKQLRTLKPSEIIAVVACRVV